MNRILISLTLISSFLWVGSEPLEAGRRKEKLMAESLELYGIVKPREFEKEAERLSSTGEYALAINRYNALMRFFPDFKKEEEVLLIVAGLEYEMGRPVDSFKSIKKFGKNFSESPRMTEIVELAFEIGKNYCVSTRPEYNVSSRSNKAIVVFEFINTHDPYSTQAAEGLYSSAAIYSGRGEWEEAIPLLREIERKHPATALAGTATVALGEAYLGLNKGPDYSGEMLEKAIFYLKGYLKNEVLGEEKTRAKALLVEVYRRQGLRLLQTSRFYCSHRKWKSAIFYINQLLEKKEFKDFYAEANELLKSVKPRI